MEKIDYSKEPEMTYFKLLELEKKRQNVDGYGDIHDVLVMLKCDCCAKVFEKHLYDIGLCFSFCCADKCLKEMERRAMGGDDRQ